jgi:hypothetical protein
MYISPCFNCQASTIFRIGWLFIRVWPPSRKLASIRYASKRIKAEKAAFLAPMIRLSWRKKFCLYHPQLFIRHVCMKGLWVALKKKV